MSATAALIWLLAALVVLRRGGYRIPLISASASRAGTWALTSELTLEALLNLASPSSWERLLQAPLAAILATLCLIVARGHLQPTPVTGDQGST